jgi:hypothetical protein
MTPTRAHEDSSALPERLGELLRKLDGRAIGLWRAEADALRQVAFVGAADLDADVATRFEQATRSVSLGQQDLGIVRAAVAGTVTISGAAQLPVGSGSGLWLRAFGAACSIAVPLGDPGGRLLGVASIALATDAPDRDAVAALLIPLAADLRP